jgi:hypothetical protein
MIGLDLDDLALRGQDVLAADENLPDRDARETQKQYFLSRQQSTAAFLRLEQGNGRLAQSGAARDE